VIDYRGVRFTYPGAGLPALDGLTLSFREGEAAAVAGRNGSGKSTLARLANGLLLPDAGEVLVDGLSTADPDRLYEVRARVGLVFQNPDNQIVASVVERDCAFALENLGLPRGEMRARVAWALEAAGLSAKARSLAHTLSGGEKQRLAIAGVLAMRPRYLVLDEPYAMLDPQGRAGVAAVLADLVREGLGIVLVTQEMEATLACARLVAIDEGRLAWDGPPADFFRDPARVEALGLEAPLAFRMAEAAERAFGLPSGPPLLSRVRDLIVERLGISP